MKTVKSEILDRDIRTLFASLELIPSELTSREGDEFYLVKFDTDEEFDFFKTLNGEDIDDLGESNWCVCYDFPDGKKKLFTNVTFKNMTMRRITESRHKMQELQAELEGFCSAFSKMDEYLKKRIEESL